MVTAGRQPAAPSIALQPIASWAVKGRVRTLCQLVPYFRFAGVRRASSGGGSDLAGPDDARQSLCSVLVDGAGSRVLSPPSTPPSTSALAQFRNLARPRSAADSAGLGRCARRRKRIRLRDDQRGVEQHCQVLRRPFGLSGLTLALPLTTAPAVAAATAPVQPSYL